MASRMLHYILAVEILKRISISDMDRFIIGCLLPDCSSHSDGSYDIAHFRDIDVSGDCIKKGINWSLFEKKYSSQIVEDSLYLGYLCHLIADAVWFKQITDKYVRIYPKDIRTKYIKRGYEDFQKLNYLLIEEYSVVCPSLPISSIDIDDINCELIQTLMQEFVGDFALQNQYEKNDLSVYPYDAVIDFINRSVSVCVKEINAFRNNDATIDPRIFYTEPRP